MIIRLCTDNENVMDVYNTMDGRTESIDVLDDYWGKVHLNTSFAPCTQWAWNSFLKLMPVCEHMHYIQILPQFPAHLNPLAAPL
jgi:hypothetical protein